MPSEERQMLGGGKRGRREGWVGRRVEGIRGAERVRERRKQKEREGKGRMMWNVACRFV